MGTEKHLESEIKNAHRDGPKSGRDEKIVGGTQERNRRKRQTYLRGKPITRHPGRNRLK